MDVLKRFPSALFVNNIEALESVRVSHSSVLSTLTQLQKGHTGASEQSSFKYQTKTLLVLGTTKRLFLVKVPKRVCF